MREGRRREGRIREEGRMGTRKKRGSGKGRREEGWREVPHNHYSGGR